MKTLYYTLIATFFCYGTLSAQWNTSGSNIYNTNNGKVGIGTSAPSAKLEIQGPATQLKIDATGTGSDAVIFMDAVTSYGGNYNTAKIIADAGSGFQSASLHFDIVDGDASGWNRTLTIKATSGSDASGNVGIGTSSPSYKLHVNGSAGKPGGGSWSNASDSRLKQDITPFTDGLEMIQQINPVWYRYNGKAGMPTDKQYVGIIAQEMQEVAPYTISSFSHEDERGNKEEYLNYDGSALTYMLVNAIKEQQQQIEEQQQKEEDLKAVVANLQEELESLKKTVYNSGTAPDKATSSKELRVLEGFALQQNTPNPFSTTTTINARVPEQVQQARIVIYNLSGLELESYPVNERGNVAVQVSGGRFSSGMYVYALLADGRVIDTKKMVLTQ